MAATRSPVDVEARSRRRVPSSASPAILGLELALIAIAAGVGAVLNAHHIPIHASAPPLIGRWWPHIGPGTPIALAVAALVTWYGCRFATQARWGRVLAAAYAASLVWTFGLALVDGWSRGIATRLTSQPEYLHDLPRVTSIRSFLATFAEHITGPGAWTTHVAGHPPGALLTFVALDRIGLRGGGWAGVTCIVVGALAPVAVAVTVRALGHEQAARAALPFLVLFPGAVWVGTSADGLFMGVAATGLALVALPGLWRAAVGGIVLGYALYLSYGLVLFALLVLVVLVLRRRAAVVVATVAGALAVATAFTVAGFWWPTGYRLVKIRYYGGYGGVRPYWYWVWADFACLVICAGPVFGPALWRAARRWRAEAPALLAGGALVAVFVADVTGLSKGETERIWLPYAIWLLAATAYLPVRRRRGWLALQAATALIVNHLLLTHW